MYFGGYYPEMGQILRQAKQAGLTTRFMGPEGVATPVQPSPGPLREGMLVTLPKRYDQVPANQPIVDALKAKKLDPTGPFVWTTYAALQSLTTGMERSGSQEPADIVKIFKPVETVMGPLT